MNNRLDTAMLKFAGMIVAAMMLTIPSGSTLAMQATSGHGGMDMHDPEAPDAPDTSQFDEREALAYSQAAIDRQLGDFSFTDSEDLPVNLGAYSGKPLVISLIYTSCYHVCPLITASLLDAVDTAQDTFGEDAFSVVTIGFDVEIDTPQRMRAYGRTQGVDLPNWRLLSADKATIDALAANLGFIYFPSTKGFDHLAQTTIIRADGRIYNHIYGDSFSAPMLMEPMKTLIFGGDAPSFSLEGLVNRVRLFCTIYDAKSGRYRFDNSLFLSIILGAICLTGVAAFLAREWIKTNRGSGGGKGNA